MSLVEVLSRNLSILLLIFGLQLFFLVAPLVATSLVTNETSVWLSQPFVRPWMQWDAWWYLSIAEGGYYPWGQGYKWEYNSAFLPLYPSLIALVAETGLSLPASAVVVARLSSLAAAWLFYLLAKHEFGKEVAFWSLLAMLVFPTAFSLYAPYTEGLFLLGSIGALLAARKRYWHLAALGVGVALLTRVTAVALIPALAIEWWEQYKRQQVKVQHIGEVFLSSALAVGVLGTISYMVHGTPFKYFEALEAGWHKHLDWVWVGLGAAAEKGFVWPLSPHIFVTYTMEVVAALSMIVIAVISWRYLRPMYATYVLFSTLLMVSVSLLSSTPRYMLGVFPMFFLLGRLQGKYPAIYILWFIISVMALLVLEMRFIQGLWAY